MASEDFGGFGDEAGDADDFGFEDDFGEALPTADVAPEIAEEAIQHAQSGMKSLPRTTSFSHQTDSADSPEEGIDEPDTTERTSRGGGVAGAKEVATGKKSGWMKMMAGGQKGRTLGRKPWKERWCKLADGKLAIQVGPQNDKGKRTIDLTHALAFERDDVEEGGDPARFSLVMKDKELFFTARNAEECSSWIENLAVGKEASTGNFTSAHSSGVSALMF
eukprot:m.175506 g.175506  ORF g.175506 m.175506 type:complete len:220 (-) comp14891_c0_seq6:5917-6576(-)